MAGAESDLTIIIKLQLRLIADVNRCWSDLDMNTFLQSSTFKNPETHVINDTLRITQTDGLVLNQLNQDYNPSGILVSLQQLALHARMYHHGNLGYRCTIALQAITYTYVEVSLLTNSLNGGNLLTFLSTSCEASPVRLIKKCLCQMMEAPFY